MVFKERLKEKRTEANLTQVELAEKAGVTARTIQNYELGSRKPSNMVTMQKIADALNTTTEYLLGSSGTYVVEAHEKGSLEPQRFTSFSPTRESCSAFIIPPPVYSIAKSVYDKYH